MFAKHFYGFATRSRTDAPHKLAVIYFFCLFAFSQSPGEKTKLTFDLSVARLAFSVVADDPGVLAMATVVRARRLFDAVSERMLLAAALYVVHVDGTSSFAEIRHHASLGHPAAVDTSEERKNTKHQGRIKYCEYIHIHIWRKLPEKHWNRGKVKKNK